MDIFLRAYEEKVHVFLSFLKLKLAHTGSCDRCEKPTELVCFASKCVCVCESLCVYACVCSDRAASEASVAFYAQEQERGVSRVEGSTLLRGGDRKTGKWKLQNGVGIK